GGRTRKSSPGTPPDKRRAARALRTRTKQELRVDDDVDAKTWPGDVSNVPSRRRLSILQTLSAPDVTTKRPQPRRARRYAGSRVTPTHRKHGPFAGPP